MSISVTDVMIATLKPSGVRRVYGLRPIRSTGSPDSLRRDGEIVGEHVRHEAAPAFAAVGESMRASGTDWGARS